MGADMSTLTPSQLAVAVAKMGKSYEVYVQAVVDNGINGKAALQLSIADLEGLGVAPLHRKIILAEIAGGTHASAATSAATNVSTGVADTAISVVPDLASVLSSRWQQMLVWAAGTDGKLRSHDERIAKTEQAIGSIKERIATRENIAAKQQAVLQLVPTLLTACLVPGSVYKRLVALFVLHKAFQATQILDERTHSALMKVMEVVAKGGLVATGKVFEIIGQLARAQSTPTRRRSKL